MNEFSNQITELESRLAFQDNTVNALDGVVVAQEKRIDQLERALKVIAQRLISLEASSGESGAEDSEPPPHY